MLRTLAVLALLATIGAASAEDIVILPTREGVTQSFLLSSPPAGKARAIAILFAGGAGQVNLERESARVLLDRGNFLVRSRRRTGLRWPAPCPLAGMTAERIG